MGEAKLAAIPAYHLSLKWPIMPVYLITDVSLVRLVLEITLYLEYMFIAKYALLKLKYYFLNDFKIDIYLS